MKRRTLAQFERFWRLVDVVERLIIHNQPRLLAMDFADAESFAELREVAETLSGRLKQISTPRLFSVPIAKGFRPIMADSAHEAVAKYLLQPARFICETWALEAHEYLKMKSAAHKEIQEFQNQQTAGKKAFSSDNSPSTKELRIAGLNEELLRRHAGKNGESVLQAYTQRDMGKFLDCSQSTASRSLAALIPGGAEEYVGYFREGRLDSLLDLLRENRRRWPWLDDFDRDA